MDKALLSWGDLLFPKQTHQNRQYNAQNDASDDGEMKTEIAAGIIDIAGHLAKPSFAETTPERRADHNQRNAGKHK